MYCKNCGKMLEEDSSFCLHCGTRVVKDKEAINISERMDMSEKTVSEKQFTSEAGYDKLLAPPEPSDITQKERKEKRQSKKGVFLVILVILIVAFAILMGITIYNAPARQLTKQLDLGNRCLEEMDYEQAIVAFTKAIEIDSMNVEAYLGLAEAYIGEGNLEKALETVKNGYEITRDERLKEKVDMYHAEYDLTHEQLNQDVIYKGEINNSINYSNEEWNEYISLFLNAELNEYSENDQDITKLLWFAYWYLDRNEFDKITYNNEYAIIAEEDVDRILKKYFAKTPPHSSNGIIKYEDAKYYYPGVTFTGLGRTVGIVNNIEEVNGEYKISFDTAYIQESSIEDEDVYYEYSLEQIKNDRFCEMRGMGEAVFMIENDRPVLKEITAYNNIIIDGAYVNLKGTIQRVDDEIVLVLDHPYIFYKDTTDVGEEICDVGLTGNTDIDMESIIGRQVETFGQAMAAHTRYHYWPVLILDGLNNLEFPNKDIDLEKEIEKIRSVYYDIQNNLSLLHETDGGGVTTRYCDSNDKIRKIVCAPDCYADVVLNNPELSGYSAEYYYDEDEQLKFVFIYNRFGEEYRYYIYDRSYCIRYIDNEGTTHDFPNLMNPSDINDLGYFCMLAQLEIAWAYGG